MKFLNQKFKLFLLFFLLLILLGCSSSRPKPEPQKPPPVPQASQSKGKTIGRNFISEALNQFQFVKDPEVTKLVQDIGRKIVQGEGSNPDNFRFLVVRGSPSNAFAVPGGYIFVFDSLLSKFKNPEELAGVLAHEIAHVERNHFFQDQSKILAANLAAIVAILLSGGEPAVAAGGLAAAADLQLRYSRENEAEADAYAVAYLQKAGFNPNALKDSLQTIAFYDRFSSFDIPIYFSTHPSLTDRQGHLELMLGKNFEQKEYFKYPVDWQRIQVSLMAGQRPIMEMTTLVGGLEGEKKDKERENYLKGVGFLKAGRCPEAVLEYQEAINLQPNSAVYFGDMAYCLLQMQEVDRAKATADEALKIDPKEPMALIVRGNVLLHKGQARLAIPFFKKALESRTTDHLLNLHLAQAYGKIGEKLLEAYHMGRFFRLDLKPREALSQFYQAQDLVIPGTDLSFKIKKEISDLINRGI